MRLYRVLSVHQDLSLFQIQMELTEFISTYIYAIEIIVLCLVQELASRYQSHTAEKTSSTSEKKALANPKKINHYTEKKNRFNPDAINIRQSWSIRESKLPPPPPNPGNIVAKSTEKILGILTGPAISFITWMFVGDKPGLKLPFDLPSFLVPLFTIGLPEGTYTSRDMSAYGLSFIFMLCSSVFTNLFPVVHPHIYANNKGPLVNYAEDFILQDYKWDLENAEEDLDKFLQKKLKSE
ncbi:hypothetical protein TVAG_109900 [Trichomonas vaginalis G3]|uniref:Uncharacterized protein n=1 Tax=Trichomonas vaginalis (strain ATCC PRA-98 / G3) TaxID=412133 RepID=A2DGJ1_TRIV3|nr:hypothetical protein TVAGG3_0998290 [Trichomonas vaginalis G3]EAY20378.1 hypothetical protein TVAG_109900 [Trichomonas vaginalis G3]KAI5490574.1 hypothetical protein TVAGG3_0998290 [Trichomonas vaginalis G3]|eukprot:XP_001581364.1 hypothetical protein [Trichomonas vaginalis G3]